jgi:hypothetical protein
MSAFILAALKSADNFLMGCIPVHYLMRPPPTATTSSRRQLMWWWLWQQETSCITAHSSKEEVPRAAKFFVSFGQYPDHQNALF